MTKNVLEVQAQKDEKQLDRQFLVALVRKWGDVNSDGVLAPSCRTFTSPHISGLIAYREESGNAVVLGDPVCAPGDKAALAIAFQNHCEERGLGLVYTIVSQDFAGWATAQGACISIEFGEELRLDPQNNPSTMTGSKAVLVRKKVKQALAEGVGVQEYFCDDIQIEQKIESVGASWLAARRGPQVYLSSLSLFNDRQGKRWFYAQLAGNIVGVLVLNELQQRCGWLLNNLMLNKEAPHGTSELLVITVLQALEKENCRCVIAGPLPGKDLGKIIGLSPLIAGGIRWLFKGAKKLFRLNGQRGFWEKFQPETRGSYLLFPKKNLTFSSVRALIRAYNAGL